MAESGVELVFVLGHPDYYPRHGFKPAGALGFEAPYPIPDKNVNAWMVQKNCVPVSLIVSVVRLYVQMRSISLSIGENKKNIDNNFFQQSPKSIIR